MGSDELEEEIFKTKGFAAGTNCSYLCLDPSVQPESIICGPNSHWTTDETMVKQEMIQCNKASLGLASLTSELKNATQKLTSGLSAVSNVAQEITDLKNAMATLQTNVESIKQQFNILSSKTEISSLAPADNERKNDTAGTSSQADSMPRDCADIKESNPASTSGVYRIQLFSNCQSAPMSVPCVIDVFCDMETLGGGWTVFQRRQDGSVNFEVGWDLYQRGFGHLSSEHWLGNDNIYFLTNNGKRYELLVELKQREQNCLLDARYSSFQLISRDKYTLNLGPYISGVAGERLSYSNKRHFTTIDRDNDSHGSNCAQLFRGGWWYYKCHIVELNGLYSTASCITKKSQHIHWLHTGDQRRDHYYSFQGTEMKLRPNTFRLGTNANNFCTSPSTITCPKGS